MADAGMRRQHLLNPAERRRPSCSLRREVVARACDFPLAAVPRVSSLRDPADGRDRGCIGRRILRILRQACPLASGRSPGSVALLRRTLGGGMVSQPSSALPVERATCADCDASVRMVHRRRRFCDRHASLLTCADKNHAAALAGLVARRIRLRWD